MDAELNEKQQQKYDVNAEHEAKVWIEGITGESFGDQSFGDFLKDGQILCKLVNKIRPGSIKKVHKMKMPFMQMENICFFLQGARSIGLADHDCFETVDLYEQKDLGIVVQGLHAFGRAVQKNVVDWSGPKLGVKEADKNVREFTDEQIRAGIGVMPMTSAGSSKTMEKSEIKKQGITFGADNAGSDGDNTMTLLGLGSKGIMERVDVSKTGITFGADNAGMSSYGDNTIPLLGLGSKDIMERIPITKPGITFGAENSSSTSDNAVPILGMGSKDIMHRNEVTKTGITFGADVAGPTANTLTAFLSESPPNAKKDNVETAEIATEVKVPVDDVLAAVDGAAVGDAYICPVSDIGSEHQGLRYDPSHYDEENEEEAMLRALQDREHIRYNMGI